MTTIVDDIHAQSEELRGIVFADLRDLQDGKISQREARVRATLAKTALETIKLKVITSPLAIGYVRDPERTLIAQSAA